MLKSQLKKSWRDIFSYHYLINHQGRTLLAATVKRASRSGGVLAYLPALDDHVKLDPSKILCTIKTKPRLAE